MSTGFFDDIEKLQFAGKDTGSDLAFRHYKPDEKILGKRAEDQLRFAVAYWHSFAWEGHDPFGGKIFSAPSIRKTTWPAPR